MPKLVTKSGKPRLLPPVHPNVGLTVQYNRRLQRLIDAADRSTTYWLKVQYRKSPPTLAMDSPASDFIKSMRTLGRKWLKQFNKAAEELGKWFAIESFQRSDATMKKHLADAGWTVKFTNTPTVRDALHATIGQQVSLIKSIGQEHFSDIEQIVLRSVQKGGDLGTMVQELQDNYGVTKRRAELIARSQNQIATSTITRVRQKELGINEAIWVHSQGGQTQRPKHVAHSGKRYNVNDGAPIGDKGQNVWPGQEINCRCVSRAIIPGLDK